MRVQDEPLRPGMQYGEDADGAADPARIAGQHDDRRGGGLDQRAVAVDLMPAQRGPQFLGHGDGNVEIGNRTSYHSGKQKEQRAVTPRTAGR